MVAVYTVYTSSIRIVICLYFPDGEVEGQSEANLPKSPGEIFAHRPRSPGPR